MVVGPRYVMNYDCGLIGLYIYLTGFVLFGLGWFGQLSVDCSVCTAHATP